MCLVVESGGGFLVHNHLSSLQQSQEMKNITEFKIEYYGEAFLKDFKVELIDKNQTLSIPTTLQFNSPWKITYNCDNCCKDVVFIEDSRKPQRNYNIINNINSNFRADTFLKEVCAIPLIGYSQEQFTR